MRIKFVLLITLIFISVLHSCALKSQDQDVIKSSASALLDSIPQEKLPFSLKNDIDDLYKGCVIHKDLNKLFSDSTILKAPFLYSNSPNLMQGHFYKRLKNKGQNRILLFSYFDKTWGEDGMSKTPTVELQVFNSNNQLIDKMIVFAGVESDCTWNRTFSINGDYIITVDNYFICKDDNEDLSNVKTKSIQQQYIINSEGKIIEYFSLKKGIIEKCEKIDFLNKSWYSKGLIDSHLKSGKWIDYEYIYNEFNELIGQYVWNNYQNGIIIGESEPLTDDELDNIMSAKQKK